MTERVLIEAFRTLRAVANSKNPEHNELCKLTELLLRHMGGENMVKVRLWSYNDKKIATIKVVREFTRVGLREAKELVESAPILINHPFSLHEGREFVGQLHLAGATAELSL